jgi:hypothetical protein
VAKIGIAGEAARTNRDLLVLRVCRAGEMVHGEAQRALGFIVTFDNNVARLPALLPRRLVCTKNRQAQRTAARQCRSGCRRQIAGQCFGACGSNDAIEFDHLSGN